MSLDTFLAPKQGRKDVIEAYGEESHKYDHILGLFLKMQEVVFDAPPSTSIFREPGGVCVRRLIMLNLVKI